MNPSTNRGDQPQSQAAVGQWLSRVFRGRSKVGGIALVVLIAAYSFAAPMLNTRFGWNLPQIRTDARGNVQLADSATPTNRNEAGESRQSQPPQPVETQPAQVQSQVASATDASDEDLLYGLLREVSPKRYLSPAGLMYVPGSAEGHRLEHLRRHTKDDPNRPGSHGVFDGDMEGALKTIDQAYDRAKKGQRTTTKVDDGRTIHTVDMGGRVGYVGGREGRNRRNPMARRVRIVLEDNRLITAYPL